MSDSFWEQFLRQLEPNESQLTDPCSACGHRARMYTVEEMMELNQMRHKLPPGHPLQIRGCPHERDDCPLLTRGPISGSIKPMTSFTAWTNPLLLSEPTDTEGGTP